jgi:AcrR family transcriptional regulator
MGEERSAKGARATRRGRRSKEEADQTRAALVAAGRELYGTLGFDASSIDAIAAAAGVTKGAFYHHFRDKADLLDTVYARVEDEFHAELGRRLEAVDDPVDALLLATDVYLDLCLDAAFRQLTLDVPAVLGWRRFRGLDVDADVQGLEELLSECVAAGRFRPIDPKMFSFMIVGALQEVSLVIGHADRPRAARRQAGEAFRQFYESLLV